MNINIAFIFHSLYQWTPLHIAAKGDHTPIVQFLVDKGADISKKSHAKVCTWDYTTEGKLVLCI